MIKLARVSLIKNTRFIRWFLTLGQNIRPINLIILEDNMLFIVTISEMDIKRYDSYDDNASYWKRHARNKVRKWRKKSWKVARESGANILGHVHKSVPCKSGTLPC